MTIDQHYVPRFIIKNWKDNNNNILRGNMKTKALLPKGAKSVFFDEYFYEFDRDRGSFLPNLLETFWRNYETKCSKYFYQLLSSGFILKNEDDMNFCKNLVLLQLCRSKAFFNTFDFENLKIGEKDWFLRMLAVLLLFGFNEEAYSILSRYGYSKFYDDYLSLGINLFNRLYAIFKPLDVRILKNTNDCCPFLLFENPVMVNPSNWFKHIEDAKSYKYIFPVHPFYAIGITKKKVLINVPPLEVSTPFVLDIDNSLIEINFCKYSSIYFVGRTVDREFMQMFIESWCNFIWK